MFAVEDVSPELGWPLAVGGVILVAIGVLAAWWGRIGTGRDTVVAVGRAVVQLAAVAAVIGFVLPYWWASLLFVVGMFIAAVVTAARRLDVVDRVVWVALAMLPAAGAVTVVIFATGAAPFTGAAIISIAGIVIGNTMTAVGQCGKIVFDALESERGQVEAALALGMSRPDAILLVIRRRLSVPLIPSIDATRTVGIVKLPGAFIGVLLGGGSAAQAGASQLLVLVGILATQSVVVVAMAQLVARGWLLPDKLTRLLPAA